MAKILLDYMFPVSLVTSTPAASTGFLKRVCVVAKPKTGQEANVGQVFACTTMVEVAARTDNTNAQQLFNAGMNQVFILLADDLNLASAMEANASEFWTVLISDDFIDDDIETAVATLTQGDLTFTAKASGSDGNDISVELLDTVTAGSEAVTVTDKKISVAIEGGVSTATQIKTAIDASTAAMALVDPVTIAEGQSAVAQAAFTEDSLEGGAGLEIGAFDGVTGISTTDSAKAAEYAAIENRVGFLANSVNKANNMFYAFGSLLSNTSNWQNQQYISMPFDDEIDTLGEANALFDDKVSFVINDDEFSNRLALFAAGGKAITAPYILKNLRIDLQSRALQWISSNQPTFTLKNASLLEARLQEDVIQQMYIDRQWISSGSVEVRLIEDNFVANGTIEVAEPRALWRVFSEMTAV